MKYISQIKTEYGIIQVETTEKAVTAITFTNKVVDENPNALTKKVVKQLKEYFQKKRKSFDLPLEYTGTSFQISVWKELSKIPYGESISYVELAKRAGSPKAYRAAGSANGQNPISIIIPCHRVINADGKLGGYGGGLPMKRFLLDLENVPYK